MSVGIQNESSHVMSLSLFKSCMLLIQTSLPQPALLHLRASASLGHKVSPVSTLSA